MENYKNVAPCKEDPQKPLNCFQCGVLAWCPKPTTIGAIELKKERGVKR